MIKYWLRHIPYILQNHISKKFISFAINNQAIHIQPRYTQLNLHLLRQHLNPRYTINFHQLASKPQTFSPIPSSFITHANNQQKTPTFPASPASTMQIPLDVSRSFNLPSSLYPPMRDHTYVRIYSTRARNNNNRKILFNVTRHSTRSSHGGGLFKENGSSGSHLHRETCIDKGKVDDRARVCVYMADQPTVRPAS